MKKYLIIIIFLFMLKNSESKKEARIDSRKDIMTASSD
jgi:hypothetical protein